MNNKETKTITATSLELEGYGMSNHELQTETITALSEEELNECVGGQNRIAGELEVKVGDKVLYSKYAGTDIKLGIDEYVLLSEKDILDLVS